MMSTPRSMAARTACGGDCVVSRCGRDGARVGRGGKEWELEVTDLRCAFSGDLSFALGADVLVEPEHEELGVGTDSADLVGHDGTVAAAGDEIRRVVVSGVVTAEAAAADDFAVEAWLADIVSVVDQCYSDWWNSVQPGVVELDSLNEVSELFHACDPLVLVLRLCQCGPVFTAGSMRFLRESLV